MTAAETRAQVEAPAIDGTGGDERDPGPRHRWRPSPRTLRRLRWAALAVWAIGLTLEVVFEGIPQDRWRVFAWVLGLAVAGNIGRRRVWLPLVDFLPLLAILVAWDYLRGAATSLGMPTLWTPQIRFDKAIFGVVPTVWLQDHLRYATTRWWDAPVSLVYLSFFLVPTATAAVLWLRSRREFYRWTLRYVALSFIGFACFALAPAAPPWAAARCDAAQVASRPTMPACMQQEARLTDGGLLGRLPSPHTGVHPYVQRTSLAGLGEMHLRLAGKLVNEGAAVTDLVAGVPSLHAGVTMLFALFFWPRVRRRWLRPLLLLYPLAMAFTVVYTGDHYVFDVLCGWVGAALVTIVAAWIERRPAARSGA